MFSNILYVVDDDSKYLLMDSVLNRSEALTCSFLNRKHHAEVSAAELSEYDLLIVENEVLESEPYENGQQLVRALKHAGVELPMILIAGLDSVQLDGEMIDWIAEHSLILVDDRNLSEHQLVHDLVRAIAGAQKTVVLDVLVLEENPEDFQLISYCLVPSGDYRVNSTHARNIEEAEELIRLRHFDAYLVSHRLGEDNSNDLLKMLVERCPERPIILLTDHNSTDVDEPLTRMLGRRRFETLEKARLSTDSLRSALKRTHLAGRERRLAAAST